MRLDLQKENVAREYRTPVLAEKENLVNVKMQGLVSMNRSRGQKRNENNTGEMSFLAAEKYNRE